MGKLAHSGAVLVALLLAASAQAADESYPIKLDRPSKAGEAYATHIVLDLTRRTTQQNPGAAPRSQEDLLSGDLAARVDVVAVDGRGFWSSFTLTVQKFTVGTAPTEALGAGAVIKVVRDAKSVDFSLVGGGTLSDGARKVLAALFSKLNDSAVADDAVFGTRIPQKIGATWPVNAEGAAKQAAGSGVSVDPKNVRGESTLQAVAADGTAVRLATHMTMWDVSGSLPAGTTAESSLVTTEIRALLPLDPTSPVLEHETTVDAALVLNVTATGGHITTTSHRHQTDSVTRIAK